MWSPLGFETCNGRATWQTELGVRGTFSILTTSLFAMTLCTWTSSLPDEVIIALSGQEHGVAFDPATEITPCVLRLFRFKQQSSLGSKKGESTLYPALASYESGVACSPGQSRFISLLIISDSEVILMSQT